MYFHCCWLECQIQTVRFKNNLRIVERGSYKETLVPHWIHSGALNQQHHTEKCEDNLGMENEGIVRKE